MRKKLIVFFSCLMTAGVLYAQVGIGTQTPDKSAILDIASNNKGVLLPRVALNSDTDKATISNPAEGLFVYNIGTGGLSTVGYLFWNGNEWVRFTTGSSKEPSITALDCTNARINPTTFKKDVPYEGVLIVPYIGGNGGGYSAGIPILSTGIEGLTAVLQPGNLEYGNGDLVFTLTGTPTESSPEPANFEIDFLGQNCTATITGDVLGIGEFVTGNFVLSNTQLIEYQSNNTSQNISNGRLLSQIYPNQMPVIDGLMMDLEVINITFYRPFIINTSSRDLLVSISTFATQVTEYKTLLNATVTPAPNPIPETGRGTFIRATSNATSANSTYLLSADNNDIVYWTTTAAEVLTTNLQVQVNETTYRWYEFTWWAMQIPTGTNTYDKKIFFSVQRKA